MGKCQYEVDDYSSEHYVDKSVSIDFIAEGGRDINEHFSAADFTAILKIEFAGIPREEIKISAHSGCGIQISYRKYR